MMIVFLATKDLYPFLVKMETIRSMAMLVAMNCKVALEVTFC